MILKSVKTNDVYEKNFHVHRKNHKDAYLYVQFLSETMVETDGTFSMVNPGDGIFYGKSELLDYYGCDNDVFNHNYMLFSPENYAEELLLEQIPKRKVLEHIFPDVITKSIADIEDMIPVNSKHRNDIISNYISIFLYKVIDEFPVIKRKFQKYYSQFYDLRKEIYQNPCEKYVVSELAENLCLAKSYFQHIYKELFGVSCIDDVINARIQMAGNLLLNSDMTIMEISEKCGYNSTEHFIRQFKKSYGITPKKFRNK